MKKFVNVKDALKVKEVVKVKEIFKDFRKFAVRGNVIDMAVGIIIGAAFGKIVDSLVKDIIMPPIGLLLGKVDFTNLFVVLSNPNPDVEYATLAAAQAAGAITLNLGLFINVVISFIIIAFAVFMLLKGIVQLQKSVQKEEEMAVKKDTTTCPYCTSTISLKATRCPFCTSELTPEAPAAKKTKKA